MSTTAAHDRVRTDVLVVGAGPGGASAATHLARLGRDVLLADGAVFPRDKACGDGLTPRAVAELQNLKLDLSGKTTLPRDTFIPENTQLGLNVRIARLGPVSIEAGVTGVKEPAGKGLSAAVRAGISVAFGTPRAEWSGSASMRKSFDEKNFSGSAGITVIFR